jgi:hypothetical protein
MREISNAFNILENVKGNVCLRAMVVEERMQLKWALHKATVMTRTGIVYLSMGINGCLL